MLPLIIVSSLLVNWLFLAQLVYAAPLAPTAQGGHLTFQQYVSEGQQSKAAKGACQVFFWVFATFRAPYPTHNRR